MNGMIKIAEFILVFCGVFIPGSFVINMLVERDEEGKLKNGLGFLFSAIAGLTAAIFCVVLQSIAALTLETPSLALMSALIFITTIAGYIGLCVVYGMEGSRVGETICAIIVAIALVWVLFQGARAISVALEAQPFLQSLIWWLVPVAFISTIGFILWNFCWFHYKKLNGKKGWLIGSIVTLVVTGILLISTLWMIKWNIGTWETVQKTPIGDHEEPTLTAEDLDTFTVPMVTAEELEELTLTKYAGISEEFLDSSFTVKDKQRTEETGFFDALTFGFKSEKNRFSDMEEEILRNPVYGVTLAEALQDKKLGTKTVGQLNPWMGEIVTKTDRFGQAVWLEYREGFDKQLFVTNEYRIYAATLCSFLERFNEVKDTQTFQTKENWPLNASAKNNDRRGVKADYQYKGEFFVLVAKTKDGKELLRIGFNTKDKRPAFPEGTPKPGPGPVPPTASGNNYTGEPDPPEKKYPNKDKSKGTQGEIVAPNDNPGPGPDTNNPDDPNHSKVEEHPNSTEVKDYKEYKDIVKELEEINKDQQTDKDPSVPTTPTKPGSNIDQNPDKLPGKDDPKPKEAKTSDGKITNNEDNPSGEWDGPKD